MNKREFLDKLQKALKGNISEVDIETNVAYYDDYIDSEVRKGKTEEEVIKEIGSPNLIAKTLITTNKYSGNRYMKEEKTYSNQEDTQYEEKPGRKGFGLNSWFSRIIALLIFIVLIVFIIGAGAAVTFIMAKLALPLIIILIIVILFRKR